MNEIEITQTEYRKGKDFIKPSVKYIKPTFNSTKTITILHEHLEKSTPLVQRT